jgi:hypothetical protein
VRQKFFLIFDDASHSVSVAGGIVVGQYDTHEAALRAAKMRGMVLTDRHQPKNEGPGPNAEPPASSGVMKSIMADEALPDGMRNAARAALVEAEAADHRPAGSPEQPGEAGDLLSGQPGTTSSRSAAASSAPSSDAGNR